MTVALVTGGTRGVGAGIARALLRSGAEVVVCGRRAPDRPVSVRDGEGPGDGEGSGSGDAEGVRSARITACAARERWSGAR
ncbi:SDR family NAD(P)-dependent oxidoreductase, partial [Streptomyces daliensis]|nr:SDR family NAD(P)-dependent oxidoreductase [Streptomyces daliensis]